MSLPIRALCSVALVAAVGCGPKQQAAGSGSAPPTRVVAVAAREMPIVESVSLLGSVAPNEMVEVHPEAEGTVKEITFDEGQRVEKGKLMLQLDESKFAAALNEAEASLHLSEATFARSKQLHAEKLISQQEFDQSSATFAMNQAAVELRRRQLKDTKVYAPFTGVVGARQISPGQVVSRASNLTVLVDLDVVKVEVAVPEKYLSQIKIGQRLIFTVAAYPKEQFEGEAYFISPQLEPGTRTALVKARVKNLDGRLKGGMYANLDLNIQLRDKALVVPEAALVPNGEQLFAYIIDEKTNAAIKPVKVGIRLAGKVEILDGLKAGDQVIVEGVQKIRPGAPVTPAPTEASAAYAN